ncbi:MAG TPA: alpha/beta hydrolase [Nocardioides sp.]|uniref:alpha/beta hydrolase n=1 Tax=Nocardioides sp. TaxID=35761 RepID=UPI002E3101FF|nr:alpha/beta hydrolase [Nocardioides sp.]HEX5089889.1 alpha/beta hydrolase [Nocardioides sp.]
MALYPISARAVEAALAEQQVWEDGYDIAAARDANRAFALGEEPEDVAEVVDLDADGVPVRLFRPQGADAGVVVHLHGGGFVFHDVDVHDRPCRRFANRLGMAVLSVDYRLAPEHRFPAPLEDIDTVLTWLDHGRAGLGEGPRFVHGDSAGGNLALVTALRHPGRFRAAVLVYPFLDPTRGFASYDLGAAAAFDPREAEWYWQQYARDQRDLTHPDLAPLLSDRLGTLPPTLVTTAEHDPLRDEGEHLAALIAEAGGDVTCTRYLGQIHGYWRHAAFPASEQAIRQACTFLRSH